MDLTYNEKSYGYCVKQNNQWFDGMWELPSKRIRDSILFGISYDNWMHNISFLYKDQIEESNEHV